MKYAINIYTTDKRKITCKRGTKEEIEKIVSAIVNGKKKPLFICFPNIGINRMQITSYEIYETD